MAKKKRKDTAIKVSRWLDDAVRNYISSRKANVEFPSKRNFVDKAVMQLLEAKGVRLNE